MKRLWNLTGAPIGGASSVAMFLVACVVLGASVIWSAYRVERVTEELDRRHCVLIAADYAGTVAAIEALQNDGDQVPIALTTIEAALETDVQACGYNTSLVAAADPDPRPVSP